MPGQFFIYIIEKKQSYIQAIGTMFYQSSLAVNVVEITYQADLKKILPGLYSPVLRCHNNLLFHHTKNVSRFLQIISCKNYLLLPGYPDEPGKAFWVKMFFCLASLNLQNTTAHLQLYLGTEWELCKTNMGLPKWGRTKAVFQLLFFNLAS